MITVYYNIFLAKELNAFNNFLADILGGVGWTAICYCFSFFYLFSSNCQVK